MTTDAEALAAWFAGRLPDSWFEGPVEVVTDRDEVLVTGRLAAPRVAAPEPDGQGGHDATAEAAAQAHDIAWRSRIAGFREDTRERRMAVAGEAEQRFGRKVSWAVTCGDLTVAFTTASVPVMTRLRMKERATLDTLIDAGVARSRSEALAWCVRLVGRNEEAWIEQLRGALATVEEVRAKGPGTKP